MAPLGWELHSLRTAMALTRARRNAPRSFRDWQFHPVGNGHVYLQEPADMHSAHREGTKKGDVFKKKKSCSFCFAALSKKYVSNVSAGSECWVVIIFVNIIFISHKYPGFMLPNTYIFIIRNVTFQNFYILKL